MKGHCTCGEVEFELLAEPMITHCCHCSWCQRESGSAFIINAYVETSNVSITKGQVERHRVPSRSGKGQSIARCPTCHTAMWSHYAGSGEGFAFVRTSTLVAPATFAPDVHIFTASKLPWVTLPSGPKVFEGFYDPKEIWSDEALDRFIATKLESV